MPFVTALAVVRAEDVRPVAYPAFLASRLCESTARDSTCREVTRQRVGTLAANHFAPDVDAHYLIPRSDMLGASTRLAAGTFVIRTRCGFLFIFCVRKHFR